MKTARILVSLSLLAAQVPPVSAAPIGFNTALPVHEGGLLFRGQGAWMRMHDDPSPMGREMDVVAVPSVLVHGATSKLALMGVFPYGVLEVNNVYQARNEAGGVTDGDSGGYQLFLTPGLQWVARVTVFELAAQLPAAQSLNGAALKMDYRLIGSFRFWF